MTEEQPIQPKTEEKEEKRKIKVIEQIDNRLAVQGQAYIKGQLKEALTLAYEIIELAKPEGLKSFIKEQEDLIATIKKLIKEKEEREREKIRDEQEKMQLEKIKKLKFEIKQLESEFIAALKIGDFQKTDELLESAKNLFTQLNDKEIKEKWEKIEDIALKTKIKKQLTAKTEKLIEDSIELKQKHHFDELKLKITELMKELKENKIHDYYNELKAVQSDILNAEKLYVENIDKIEKLVNKISILQDEKSYKNAISNCEQLIQLAGSINKNDLIDVYSRLLTDLKEDLKFEELKGLIQELNEEGLSLLRKGEIISSLEKFKTIQKSLKEYRTPS